MNIENLTCCVCGAYTKGRQWHNRDTGYGICPDCITWLESRDTDPAEMKSLYGINGTHYNTGVKP